MNSNTSTLSSYSSASRIIVRLLAAAALIGYILPWTVNNSAALTLNAYDLAEWLSLHPLSRANTPPLMASFWLRLQLVLIVWVSLYLPAERRRNMAFSVVFLVLLVISLVAGAVRGRRPPV